MMRVQAKLTAAGAALLAVTGCAGTTGTASAQPACASSGPPVGAVQVSARTPADRETTRADPAAVRLTDANDEEVVASFGKASTEALSCRGLPNRIVAKAASEVAGRDTQDRANAEFGMSSLSGVVLEAGLIGVVPVNIEACDLKRESSLLACQWAPRPSNDGRGEVLVSATYTVTVDGQTAFDVPLRVMSDARGRYRAQVGAGQTALRNFRTVKLPGAGILFAWDDTPVPIKGKQTTVTLSTDAESTVECTPGGQCLVGVTDLTDPPLRSTKPGGIRG